jgi:sugar lactone lactonase YvrE
MRPTSRPRGPFLIRAAKAPATTPPPLAGAWAPGDARLDAAELFPLPDGHGPEDVVVDPAGRVVSGDAGGRLWRWPAEPGTGVRPELLAETGGRPLGIEIDPVDGDLIVCDAYRGLLKVRDDGAITELTSSAAGARILFCNNAAVARDGTVYFTDSSARFPLHCWKRDLLEHRPNGRILAYHPGTRRTEVLAVGLHFPNGVALTADESALLFVETAAYRLSRLALRDAEPTVLAEFPAYPDNMAGVGDGTYWIALPDRLRPQPDRYSMAALVDGAGQVLRVLHGPGGRYPMLTGIRQHGDTLWLGSLTQPGIARIRW